jgi:hypothetical protein
VIAKISDVKKVNSHQQMWRMRRDRALMFRVYTSSLSPLFHISLLHTRDKPL